MFNWYFAAGDLGFFWEEQIQAFSWLPQVWKADQGFGLDGLLSLWLDYPFQVFVKVLSTFGLSWFVIEKLLWLSVFTLAIYSSYKLTKSLIGSLVYSTNTYFLLLFNGGQLGVALAYGLSPLVLSKFIQLIDSLTYQKESIKQSVRAGLLYALLIVFDLRLAYLILSAIFLYFVIRTAKRKSLSSFIIHDSLFTFLIPLLTAVFVHLYWILPTALASRGASELGEQFTNPGMLKFLSFADFSHAISLLHPNWPENLFGKIYFMQPEFLVIPILAFVSLLFVSRLRVTGDELRIKKATTNPQHVTRSRITYFTLLALIGSFFAKGVNEPFGEIYRWMFVHIPGFVMFRDPTKFYLFTAIGYSVLIPFVLSRVTRQGLRITGYIVFIIFWIVTLRDFKIPITGIPAEYIELKNLLIADAVPSRTLWIWQKEGFAYFSDTHPILTATDSSVIDPSVRYVIIPMDAYKRIFLNDYVFDEAIRDRIVSGIPLSRDSRFQDFAVFENPDFTGMKTEIPDGVSKQQQFANIGFVLSIGALICFIWILFF